MITIVLFCPTMGSGIGSGKTPVPTTHYRTVSANSRHISVTNSKQDRQCPYNNVVSYRSHCCNRNPTIRSVRFVELHVIDNNIKIICVAQICFHGEFMWPETIKTYFDLHVKFPIFWFTNLEFLSTDFHKSPQYQI